MGASGLVSLPLDILFLLPEKLHTIEDLINTASTCRRLRECMAKATPNIVLRLAAAQTRVFFRPSPHFLVTATARELGNWARESDANEQWLALKMQDGVDGLLELALDHCGITLERIRQLHSLRFSLINPVTDIIDMCVGAQWYQTPDFWNGGVDDAYTICADPSETLFHLALYGELFAPDFEPILDQNPGARTLSVDTRLEFIKYCVPEYATYTVQGPDESLDARRAVKATGPYAKDQDGKMPNLSHNHNIALTWVIRSSRFRPRYRAIREKAGTTDFQSEFEDEWWYDETSDQDWRQRLWEDIMICQGLEGLGMLVDKSEDQWMTRIREWKDRVAKLKQEPPLIHVGHQATHNYPYLLGDLRICASGHVMGT